ncbi:MAG TPA: penicillin acylase family protein [Vicinamibacterales bacterium]|nr:penicillin acylase family protein [Vicinamibacterales bacterium]
MKRLLVLTFLLLLTAGGGAYWWARGSLPVLDGQFAYAGLRAPVQVLFDQYGVPSVYARDPEDAWFTAGVLHARDRLWQMELYRRVTMGRLSEVLGDNTLDIDKRFLTLGLRDAAQAEWERANPDVRAALLRYAEGVNAVVTHFEGRQQWPLEFQILGFLPAEWKPVDSLAVGRLLAWRLAENHQAELMRAALAGKFGADTALQLTGRYPASAPTILESRAPAAPVRPTTTSTASSIAYPDARGSSKPLPPGLEWLSAGARRGNSNNWVLAPGRTKGGRPILANDPHLQIEFPSVWYEMHLIAAGLDVIGVTIPSVPFVVLGHNQRIAWGITNTNADVQDIAIERVDVGGKRAMYRGSWAPVQVVQADIPVRGRSAPVPFEVWKTRNGSIFADVEELDWEVPPMWLSPQERPSEERRAYSLHWDTDGDLAAAFEAINRASDWGSFTTAVNAFAVPSSNLVYADVDGNVGYVMSGKIPRRSSGDGRMPVDGNVGTAWTGYLDPSTLPRVLNPASGFITSSNNEIDRSFPNLISHDWAAPFRAMRLKNELSKVQGADLDSMAALQNDRYSVAADILLAGLEEAIKKGRASDAELQWAAALEQLVKWDRVVDNRPVVSYFQAFEHAVWRRTFVDEMEDALFDKFYEWAGAEKPAGLYAILADPTSSWFDDITTVERKETRDEIFLIAAQDAEIYLQREYGGVSRRDWADLHAARFSHPLGNIAFPFAWLFNRGPVPVEGDGTTVMRISWNRLKPFQAWEYPSWRQLFDVGEWNSSRVSMPSGQSGHPLSPFYFDQTETWRQGRYRTQPFSRNAVNSATRHRLLLVP